MKNKNMITGLFNPRLFLEGLKRLRVVGLATAILSMTITALVPVSVWLTRAPEYYPMTMETELLCVPVGILVFLAPLFFLTLFSFLQKRKESDFFHAIPYTRTCVYVSFTAAALAFVFTIQAACGLIAGILWGLAPGVTFDLGGMVAYVFICMLAAAMLSSFMLLALTLSGTGGSCMLLFALFACFTRVVCFIFLFCLQTIRLLPADDIQFLMPTWFLPVNTVWYFGQYEGATAVMYSLPNILYSLAVTLGVFALAGFLYLRRKSEMAGNPAPGVRTQALFRILFTLPLALLIPQCFITNNSDEVIILVLAVVVLLVYFLYELITTKRAKNMLKAIPALGFLVGACILFSLAFYGYRTVVLYEKIDTDDIKTVSIETGIVRSNSYQRYLVDDYRIDDPEILELIATQLADSQYRERTDRSGENYWARSVVTIRLKSGRSITRSIILNDLHIQKITKILMEDSEVKSLLYKLPEKREVDEVVVYTDFGSAGESAYWITRGEINQIMETFRAEYAGLNQQQKDKILIPILYWEDKGYSYDISLTLSGTVNGNGYSCKYYITSDMPKTRRLLLSMLLDQSMNRYDDGSRSTYGTPDEIFTTLEKDMDSNAYEKILLRLSGISVDGKPNKGAGTEVYVTEAQLKEVIAFLRTKDQIRMANGNMDRIAFTENSCCINLTVNGSNYKNAYAFVYLNGFYNLTPEDWAILFQLCTDRTPA